jgi:hypothetical protein
MHTRNLFACGSRCDGDQDQNNRAANRPNEQARPDCGPAIGKDLMDRENRASMDEIHLRILRVTEDLRAIQRELNCAAMQAPNDPELMEALSDPPEMESLNVLKSALDQMRHFLWFYMQVMTSGSEMGEKLRQSLRPDPVPHVPETEKQQHMQNASDAIMLRYLADSKFRKPN